jgi:hypothetical protein
MCISKILMVLLLPHIDFGEVRDVEEPDGSSPPSHRLRRG